MSHPASTSPSGRPARSGQGGARELAGLLRPDGSVLVPPSVASELLRLLVKQLIADARSTGGQPTATARMLLSALYEAAQQHEQQGVATDTPDVEQPSQGLTVREVAARMGCSTSWVRQLLADGRLTGRRAGGVWIVEARPCGHWALLQGLSHPNSHLPARSP
jgi:excisionase family DNA binding protein